VTGPGVVSGVSVSHVNASIDDVETASESDERTAVRDLLANEGVSEAFALQTCNRAEAYVVTDRPELGRAALESFVTDVPADAVVWMTHEGSLRHLMRVAAGLESLVLGEDQILGQVKTAFEEARAVGGVGTMLEDAVTKAIHVGERARTETGINEGVVSLGSAAVELARSKLELDDATALVVGAGEMGKLAAHAFDRSGVSRLVVANRTVPHAEHVAEDVEMDARVVGLDAAAAAAARADVVVTATGAPDYVLDAEDFVDAGETLVIDIAQPRDVAPTAADADGVRTYDIDSLQSITDRTRTQRRAAADRVEAMIDDEFDRLLDTYKRKRADDAISAMYESAELVKERELTTALSKLDAQGSLTEEQRETVEALADALVGQLLAPPTKSLREAAAEDDFTTIQTALRLFDPGFGDAPEGVDAPEMPREGTSTEVPQHVFEQSDD
jgi:glutamyl-tRNA reductase